MGKGTGFNVDIDFVLPAEFISEGELGLIQLHLGSLIKTTFNRRHGS